MASVSNEIVMRLRMIGAAAFQSQAKEAATGITAIGTAEDKTARKTDRLDRKTKGLHSSFGKFGKRLAIAGAVAGAGRAMQTALRSTEELTKGTLRIQRVTGLDTETASQWAEVTRVRGVNAQAFGRGLTALSKQMVAARTGTGESAAMFQRLGVSMDAIQSGDTGTVLMQIADGFAQMGDPALKASYATKLLGKSGQELTPLFANGTQALQDQLDMAKKYGAVISNTDDAKKLIEKQREMRYAMDGLKVRIGEALIPTLVVLADKLGKVVNAIRPILDNKAAMTSLLAVLTAGFVAWGAAAAIAAAETIIAAGALLAIPAAVAAIGLGLVVLYNKWQWFHNAVNNTWSWIVKHWPLLLYVLAGPLGVGIGYAIKNFESLRAKASSVLNFIRGIPGRIANAFRSLAGKIGGLATDFYNAGKKIGEAIVHGVTEFIRSAPGSIVDALAGIVPGGKLGKSILSHIPRPHIPHIGGATGGTITRAGRILVGERGPEVVSLQRDARIIPLPNFGDAAPAIAGGTTVAKFYLENRLVAQAVAQHTSDVMARR